MEKELKYVELFELYKGLLTERQRELFSSHYLYDLSLGEIAEQDGITRQNVLSAVKKVKEKLEFYESVLHLKETFSKVNAIKVKDGETAQELINRIKEIIGR